MTINYIKYECVKAVIYWALTLWQARSVHVDRLLWCSQQPYEVGNVLTLLWSMGEDEAQRTSGTCLIPIVWLETSSPRIWTQQSGSGAHALKLSMHLHRQLTKLSVFNRQHNSYRWGKRLRAYSRPPKQVRGGLLGGDLRAGCLSRVVCLLAMW